MSLCPFAVKRLLPESATQAKISPRMHILHSAGGHGSLYGFFLNSSSLESHFWVGLDGTIEQYIDTNVRADANLNANGYAISTETENEAGDSASSKPWTQAQVNSIIKLNDWLAKTHPNITRRLTPDPKGSGLAWHIQFGAPGPWTTYAKVCPGAARIEQIKKIILPAFNQGVTPPLPFPGADEVTEAECKKIVNDAIHILSVHLDEKLHRIGVNTDAGPRTAERVEKVVAATDSLEASVGAIKAKVGA